MGVVGAKPAPPLHGALQWTGSNQAEFVAFGGPNATVSVDSGNALFFYPTGNSSDPGARLEPGQWLVTAHSGRGIFPTQVVPSTSALQAWVFTDEEFQAQFTTAEDWPITY
jgi:hypothetical protein